VAHAAYDVFARLLAVFDRAWCEDTRSFFLRIHLDDQKAFLADTVVFDFLPQALKEALLELLLDLVICLVIR